MNMYVTNVSYTVAAMISTNQLAKPPKTVKLIYLIGKSHSFRICWSEITENQQQIIVRKNKIDEKKKISQELMEEFSSTTDLKCTQIFWDKKLLFFSSECKQDML